ncbi:hypothetical protein ACWIWK_03110 [Helicobacter sp. 23-1048]
MKKIALVFAIFVGVLSAKNICDRALEYEFLQGGIKEYLHIMSSINQINQELFDVFSAYFVSLGFHYLFCEAGLESGTLEENPMMKGQRFNNIFATAEAIFREDSEFAQYTPQCGIQLREQLASLYKRLDKASISEKEKQVTIPAYLLALGSLHLFCTIAVEGDDAIVLFDSKKYEDVPLLKKYENEWRKKIKNYIKGK